VKARLLHSQYITRTLGGVRIYKSFKCLSNLYVYTEFVYVTWIQ